MYLQSTAPDVDAACRWAAMVRREIDRLGLGECPVFDPDIDIDLAVDPFEPYDTFDDLVADCITCTDARARRH